MAFAHSETAEHVRTTLGAVLRRRREASELGLAEVAGPAQIFVASTFDVAHLTPWGSHPLLDPHFSSQRL